MKRTPVKCIECAFSSFVPVSKGNPIVIYCSAYEQRCVARSLRKCKSFKPCGNVD